MSATTESGEEAGPETPDPTPTPTPTPPPTPSPTPDQFQQLLDQNAALMAMLAERQAAPAPPPAEARTPRVVGRLEGYDVVPPPERAAEGQYGLQEDGSILVHIVKDGFTAIRDQPWYVGEELRVYPGTPEWALIYDAAGHCLIVDDEAQWDRYRGEVYYLEGPWRGRGYTDKVKFDMPEEYDELAGKGTQREFTGWTDTERRKLAQANAARGL